MGPKVKATLAGTLLAISLAALPIFLASRAGAQPVPPPFDHLKCYKIKDYNSVKVIYKLDLKPEQTQFLDETGCMLKNKAKWFCIDVQKTNVTVLKSRVDPPPDLLPIQGEDARDYLCYKLKCPKTVLTTLDVEDQFAQRNIVVKDKPDFLCAPANKVGVAPKPTMTPCQPPQETPTPVPTQTPTHELCNIGGGPACFGDCEHIGQEFLCLFNPSAGCQCEPPQAACRDVDPGSPVVCGGLCPNAPEVCLITGQTTCECKLP